MLDKYETIFNIQSLSNYLQRIEGGKELKCRFFFKAFLQVFSNLPQKCFFDVNLFVIELLIEWFLSNQPLQRKALEKFLIPGTKEKNILATKLYSKKILNVYFLHLNARITLEIQTNDILLMTLRLGHLG